MITIKKTKQPDWAISEELSTEECWISQLMVLRSAAGYYIGRLCMDRCESNPDYFPFSEPFSRESGYFRSEEKATKALQETGFVVRSCAENNLAYATGALKLTTR